MSDGDSTVKVDTLAKLVSAINDAKTVDSKEIKLTGNISIKDLSEPLSIPNGVTLDLNGHTLSIPTIGNDNSNRIAIADDASVTIKNGKITYSGSDESKSPIMVGKSLTAANAANSQTLTLTNVNISSNGYGIAVFAKGDLTVNDGSITAVNSAISTNGGDPDAAGTTNSCDAVIKLNGGQYVSTKTAAIFFPGGKELTVNEDPQSTSTSTFFGKTGFDIRSGNVIINNATIYVTGYSDEEKTDNTGPTPWGMGIAIFDNAAYGKNTDSSNQITQTPISVTYANTTIVNAQYNYSVIGFSSYSDIKGTDGSLLETLPTFTASHDITLTDTDSTNDLVTIENGDENQKAVLADKNTTHINYPIDIETINGDNFIFANKNAITISAGSDSNSKITYGSEYTTFIDNFDLSTFTVFGGNNNDNTTVTSTNVTMDGGNVYGIAGGGYGEANVTASNVTINGGAATYVTGGGWSTVSTVANTNNMTNRTETANITISDGNITYALGGGRLGYAYVETANLTINGGTFDEIVAGGVNGYTGTAKLIVEAKDGKSIKSGLIASGNRGQVNDATVEIKDLGNDGSVTNVAIGALTWKTSTDGGPNAIFDNIDFTIAEDLGITNIYLGGSVWTGTSNPWASGRTNSLSVANITVNASGYAVKAADVDSSGEAAARAYTIDSGKTWTLANETLEIIEGSSINLDDNATFTNNGTIVVNDLNGLVSAAAIGGKIQLATDIAIENLTTFLTLADGTVLDLNDKTLTMSKTYLDEIDSKSKSINRLLVNNGEVTIKNGNIVDNATSDDRSPIIVSADSGTGGSRIPKLILDDVKITSTNEYGVVVFTGKLEVKNNSSITAGLSAISGNGTKAGSDITLNGGTYTSTNSAAIFFPSTTSLTVNDGTFTGKTGFDIRAGTVSINDAKIVITSPVGTTDTSGPSSWGMGIAVIDHPSYGKNTDGTYSDITVTIDNVKVTGAYGIYVGDLNRNDDGTFNGTDGTFDQKHKITIKVNEATVYDKPIGSNDYFTYKLSSGSGSSGGIVVPPVVPDVPDEPTIIPDENNNVNVPEINEETTKELIHEAVSSGSNSISIIDTSDVKGEYSAVTVSKSDLETIAKSIENNKNIDSVSIPTSEGNIIIEKEVLSSILENTSADSVSFGVEDAKDKLTEEQKKAVGDRPVYDINIKAGNENVTSFNGKTITISLPYTLKAGEDPENIVVYYVRDDGSLEKIDCEFKDGKVVFDTDHLSKYVIAYEEQDKPVTPDTPDNKKDDNTIYYAVAAVIIILIIIALAYFFMKKKQ